MKWRTKSKAFTLVEVLVVTATIGVLATVGYIVLGDLATATKKQKLSSDTDQLNRAVQVYLASGGSLEGADSTEDVIARLKSAVDSESSYRLPGLSSQLVDPRLTVKTSSQRTGSKGDPVAVWNAERGRFIVSTGGEAGVSEFYYDDSIAEDAPASDVRKTSMAYAEDSGWIWDYSDRNPINFIEGPTAVPVVSEDSAPTTTPTGGPGGGGGSSGPPSSPPPPSAPVAGTLAPPVLAVPGGTYSIRDFEMSVPIINRNPSGTSKLVYAIDYGTWLDYTDPVIVPPGSVLSAQAVALIPEWEDSRKIDQTYAADPAPLDPPLITTSRDSFGYLFGRAITVSLDNPNPAGSSTMRYRLNGGSWSEYGGPFSVARNDYPGGLRIEAEAVPASSPYWLASSVSDRSLTLAALDLSGRTGGAFSNPLGSSEIVTNISGNGTNENSLFEWGDIAYREGETRTMTQSSLDFAGLNFGNIQEGARFQIGNLSYYNGSAYAFDAATGTISLAVNGVTFGVDVNLRADGVNLATRFNFDFELLNTVNVEDPLDPWPDADFVRLNRTLAVERLQIDDRFYDFTIEFGETTENGFATFNEFHVLENAGAGVKMYGTFAEVLFP